MTVADLIAKLQTFDPALPVCLADWQEGYMAPSEAEAESVAVVTGRYTPTGGRHVDGTFLRIGSDVA